MEKGFRVWLQGQGFDRNTVSTQMSHVARLERHFGDLDIAFEADGFERIRNALAYTKEDERNRRPNPAPFAIEGNLYSNLAGYRTTLNYYSDYRKDSANAPGATAATASSDAEIADAEVRSIIDGLVDRFPEQDAIRYDELLQALPKNLSVAGAEAVMNALRAGGITIGPEGKAKVASIILGPDGSLPIDLDELDKMRSSFLARFPDFEELGFEATQGSYWDTERGYKQTLIDQAAKIYELEGLGPEDVGYELLRILGSSLSNLLNWRELARIKEVQEEAPGLIERALGEMALSALPAVESVARCVEQIAEPYLRGQESSRPFAHLRTLPTTALALARPGEAIAVRYSMMHLAGMRLTGRSLFRNAPMSAQEYGAVLALAHHIATVMRDSWGWRPRDLWDVQGFLWVANDAGQTPDPIEGDSADEPEDEPAVHDRYRTQADDPAMVDALERGPFAAVLAARIVEIRASERTAEPDSDRAFMVHLHGPWGSGKSSILNLLRRELEQPKEGKAWLVVIFNAWKQQRMRPPWWALMTAIYRSAVARCSGSKDRRTRWGERVRLWRLWWWWRVKAEWLPILLVGLLLGGLAFALTRGLGEAAKIGIPAVAALAGVYAYARLMIFGSQKAVQTYADLTTDPYRRIIDLFNRLVAEIKPPLVVFVDDLDRCDSEYVVELLEGIQTLFRHAPVTYVVAADRKWICSSFEKKYGDFSATIGEPCRPLGYLFLDKLFQISAEMPRLTREIQASYLSALLRDEAPEATGSTARLIARAKERVKGINNEADLQELIEEDKAQAAPGEAPGESLERQRALRHAAALQITSAQAAAATEHRLQKLSHLLEPNPRSMKRLVNAVGMAQARGILEGRTASPETRARWAMLSLRWPLFADFIADNPAAIAHWRKTAAEAQAPSPPDPDWPPAVRALHGERTVMEVVGCEGEEGALTPESLDPLLA
jgi:hypothetical protein